jgi:two-component system, OmpR family, phosphate regulon response regulator PhoB
MTQTILVVDDEPAIVELVRYNLEKAGFHVATAGDGREARLIIDERAPDLVVLDWMLPERSGLELCRELRRKPGTRALPIVLLTARGEESDRIRGLETGADDYVSKPFSPSELVARVRALLRRSQPGLSEEKLSFGDIEMDLAAHRVMRAGRPVHLGPTEFRLLRFFLQHPGRVFDRERLLTAVWGIESDIEIRTVDVHIRRLRKALTATGEPDLIRTVRSAGYSIEAMPQTSEKVGG